MSEDTESQSPSEPTPASGSPTPSPETTTVEFGESVRKGTQVMPELSVPQNFDPPSAAPIDTSPVSDTTPAAPPSSSEGADGSSSAEQ